MVAIAVLAIVLAMAVPAFAALINTNRLVAQSNELVASLQLARSEAVRRNANVVLCPSSDGSSCAGISAAWPGWIVRVSSSGELLRANLVDPSVQVRASAAVNDNAAAIVFYPDGLARDASNGLLAASIAVCMAVSRPENNQRRIGIAAGSRVAISSENTQAACAVPADE
ncbi:GspH/FimT family pseudopilin [Xanthomonas campestris pv. phormiicola]|nr:GspH/FimT family pseudopilin [Xanthomonas campestris pv. phormiicola]